MLLGILVLLLQAGLAPCACADARVRGGWCPVHGLGYVGGLEVRSQHLFDVLDAHGHDVDLGSFHCTECRRAIETEGFCETDRIGFVRGQAYFSRLTYLLARGEVRDPAQIGCPVCRKNAASRGFCPKCAVGMAGGIALRSKADFETVERELIRVQAADEMARRCEHCAVALLTDTRCPMCKIAYKDGRPQEAAKP